MNTTIEPIPMRLLCPRCHELHVDAGVFATKAHHTHACQFCGEVWRPAVVATVGVQFLPGFKDEPPIEEACTQPVAGVARDWQLQLDGVKIERQDMAAGWAVFSGTEGEDPTLRAFFPGQRGKDLATILLATKDPEEDELVIFDGDMAPAVLVSGIDTDGGLFVANDFDTKKAIAAMARAWGQPKDEWQDPEEGG